MTVKCWDQSRDIELLPCPFCGGKPKIKYTGNEYTKQRTVEVACSDCKVKRRHGALKHGFDWLECIAEKAWNQRT